MARIYVSSTFSDLEEHRAGVRTALQRLGHEDVAMERYGAEDRRPVEKCLEDVESCDAYLGIFAWRYGFVPPGHDRSITELEYRKAAESGKECLIFLIDEEAQWPFSRIEVEALDRVRALREELRLRHTVALFKDEADLRALVSEAVANWERRRGLKPKPGTGNWDAYRLAVFEAHRWVRLAVIAGAKQDRITRIPLAEVFVPQVSKPGQPLYEIPEEVLRFKRDLFYRPGAAAPEEAAAAGAKEVEDEPEYLAGLDVSFPEPILDVLGREKTQVVLGGPGSGKSTLMHYVLLSLCDPDRAGAGLPPHLRAAPTPFLIELRQYALMGAADFVTYVAGNAGERYGVQVRKEDLVELLKAEGGALVIFDGLDEVFDPAGRSRVIQQFESFAREYPNAQTVVTSRIVGYEAAELKVAGFQHYTLLDFNVRQIREFVPAWYRYYTWEGDERDAASLTQRIVESPRLTELAGNPLLLTMMAVIYKHQDLPEQRWKLYERCTEVLLEDWDIKRKSIDLKTSLRLDIHVRAPQKAEILQRVSTYMLEHGQRGRELNAIAYQPLVNILARYLSEKYNRSPGDAEAMAEGILLHLRERTYILAEVGEGIFGFVHRTFMEYFAAGHCQAEFNARRSDYEWLTREVFANWERDEWQEVLLLLIGMLSDQNSPIGEVIDFLRQRSRREVPFNLAFAARCLAEAGVDEGDPAARELLNELVGEMGQRSSDEGEQVAAFINAGLTALSSLAPMLGPTAESRAVIRQLEKEKALRPRMLAWQMGLALRTRQERFGYALAALRHREEAVRRGAVTALERGWPGNPEVEEALLEVVRRDTLSRVRQAAIQALQRSWPKNPRILDAIESRLGRKGAYTDLVWLIGYLSANWRGNTKALELILKSPGHKLSWEYEYLTVIRSAVDAVLDGWRDYRDTFNVLRHALLKSANAWIQVTAAITLVLGWPGKQETYALLHELAVEGEKPGDRKLGLMAATGHLSNAAFYWSWPFEIIISGGPPISIKYFPGPKKTPFGEAEARSLLTDRIQNDPDEEVRELARIILEQLGGEVESG